MRMAFLAFGLFIGLGPASAAEIDCLFPVALKSVLGELLPQFEKSSGHTVKAEYGVITALTVRLQKDEVADIAILSDGQIAELQKQGKIVEGSRAGIAKLGFGAFIRRGMEKPDISSVESFKQAVLSAKAIAYVDPATGAPSGIYMSQLMGRLGIAEQMKPKTKLAALEAPSFDDAALFDAVVRGDADIGFTLMSEILAEQDVALAGPLPPGIQNFIPYAAGIVMAGKQREAGAALIAFLTSPPALATFKRKGFDPF